MKRGQSFRFFIQLSSNGAWHRLERFWANPTALVSPRSGDGAIDQKDWHRVRGLGVEDDGPELLRHDLGPARVDHRQSFERLQETDGSRRRLLR